MNPISQFEKTVDAIYGVYLDSTNGFKQILDRHNKIQKQVLKDLQKTNPKLATIDYLDQTSMIYGKGDPGKLEAYELHRSTQKQYKERNMEGGLNYLFIGNMVLVSLYHFWEDHYRSEIAILFGKEKNGLKEPIMGDIRILRNSIIHHAGIAKFDVEHCTLLKWFHKGDTIYLDNERLETIIYEIKGMIRRFQKQIE